MNKQNKKGQTATEYMIIVAVVIVIAVVVASILGGFPGIGSGTGDNVKRIQLRNQEVAVDNFGVVDGNFTVQVRNNYRNTQKVTSITVNGDDCTSLQLPLTLNIGATKAVTCDGMTAQQGVPNVVITWEDVSMNASYSTAGTGDGVAGGTPVVSTPFPDCILVSGAGEVEAAGDLGGDGDWNSVYIRRDGPSPGRDNTDDSWYQSLNDYNHTLVFDQDMWFFEYETLNGRAPWGDSETPSYEIGPIGLSYHVIETSAEPPTVSATTCP